MQPPDASSALVSTPSVSVITTGSRIRRRSTTPRAQHSIQLSSTPRAQRSRLPSTPRTTHSQGLGSSQVEPYDSVSQVLADNNEEDEEAQLLAEVQALQKRKRIQDLAEQKRQLTLELQGR